MNKMRKLFALMMVALLALTFAIAAVGCGKKAEEAPANPEATTTPAPAPADSTMGSAPMDSMHADTAAAH